MQYSQYIHVILTLGDGGRVGLPDKLGRVVVIILHQDEHLRRHLIGIWGKILIRGKICDMGIMCDLHGKFTTPMTVFAIVIFIAMYFAIYTYIATYISISIYIYIYIYIYLSIYIYI